MNHPAIHFPSTRRRFLRSAGAGLGGLALSSLLGRQSLTAADSPQSPRAPHFAAKAKRMIFLFMEGAMSGHDTFDYKPELQNNGGKTAPGGGILTPSKFAFRQYGQTGSWFSE